MLTEDQKRIARLMGEGSIGALTKVAAENGMGDTMPPDIVADINRRMGELVLLMSEDAIAKLACARDEDVRGFVLEMGLDALADKRPS